MYTWGYIKENTLGKLNLTADDYHIVNVFHFISRFHYYANEAMTQICSAIKPKETYYVKEIKSTDVNQNFEMPDDFIAFSDNPILWSSDTTTPPVSVSNECIKYVGFNEFSCAYAGVYHIPYDARWFFFTNSTKSSDTLPIPADICDALPSYIASQCIKIDDETRAAILRNEFELFLARMNDTTNREQGTFYIGGNW